MTRRGTSNRNDRGGSVDRKRRRTWLIATYRADTDVDGMPACRCYRCGVLLTDRTITVDRIIPHCRGGTYRHNNIRPSCGPCNSVTGGSMRSL